MTKSKWEHFAENQEEEAISERATEDRSQQEEPTVDPVVDAEPEKNNVLKEENLRLLAEMRNVRDRAARDVTHAHRFANERFASDLLAVVDSIVRGLASLDANDQNLSVVRDGMQLTLDLFYNVLQKHGVTVINPALGDPFKPDLHEAVSMQQVAGALSNTVLEVLQQGYLLNGRVVRAAMVVVAG